MLYRFPKTLTNKKIENFYKNKIILLKKELKKSKSIEYTKIIKEKISQHIIEKTIFTNQRKNK
tara:strand:- start:905 stop:1093 length:189 start_codon:yes stop_codon:yes gene_type:complete